MEPYCIRIFARSPTSPSAAALAEALRDQGWEGARADGDAAGSAWRRVTLTYRTDRPPLTLVRSDEALAPFRAEVVGGGTGARAARAGLDATGQLLRLELPPEGLDEEGWEAQQALIDFLIDELDGLVRADGEAWYDAEGELLVDLGAAGDELPDDDDGEL